MSPSKTALEKCYVYCPPPLLDEIYAPARIRSTNRFVKKNVGGVQYKPRGDWFSFATVRKLYFLCSCKQTRETSISHRRMLYVLHQGWGTLILEGHSPAEFSSNPEKPWKKIPNCILKTLISCFRCVWLGLELNSAGHRPSRINVPHPCPTSSTRNGLHVRQLAEVREKCL